MAGSFLVDLNLRFLSRRRLAAALAVGLAPVLGSIGIAPPWPTGITVLTAGGVLVFLLLSLQFLEASQPQWRLRRISAIVAIIAVGIAYGVLFERFTFELPTTGGRILLGCGFTPEAAELGAKSLIDTTGDCPGHFEDLLEKAQYEAHFIWTKRSITAVRFGLVSLWSVWFACFAVLASAVLTQLRQPAVPPETHVGSVDVFVSYAREDFDRVEKLVRALESEGFNVWWDLHLAPGQTWDEVLKQRIESARSVVVVWSRVSVEKRWVLEEALTAANRRVIVPVRIDDVEPPFGFTRFHAACLIAWDGSNQSAEYRKVVGTVGTLVGPKP